MACKLPFKVDDWLELTIQEILTLGKLPPHPAVVPLYGITVKLHRGDLDLFLIMEVSARVSKLELSEPPPGHASRWLRTLMVLGKSITVLANQSHVPSQIRCTW